jgi:hypothetical protein
LVYSNALSTSVSIFSCLLSNICLFLALVIIHTPNVCLCASEGASLMASLA